jgi:hypothetical protein
MAARVLHFGTDVCNRCSCSTASAIQWTCAPLWKNFHSVLQKGTGADAVLVTAGRVRGRHQVVTLTRERSHAALVLFSTCYDYADEGKFDLVIPPLTRPEEWLRQIADVIAKSVALKAAAAVIQDQSAQLREDMEIVIQQSRSDVRRQLRNGPRQKGLLSVSQKPEPSGSRR